MTIDDAVRVFPHGSPRRAALGTVLMISKNERAIAVGFDDKPSFAFVHHNGMFLTRDHAQFVFFAVREAVGPWIEMGRRGHYEIEPL